MADDIPLASAPFARKQAVPLESLLNDAQSDPIQGGQQSAANYPLQISPRGGGQYAVINPATGQVIYVGSIDGARAAQASGIAVIRRTQD